MHSQSCTQSLSRRYSQVSALERGKSELGGGSGSGVGYRVFGSFAKKFSDFVVVVIVAVVEACVVWGNCV